jgi:hypothetical protein
MKYVLYSLIIANLLIESDIDTFRRLGTGRGRSFAVDTEEMSQIIIQDVWPPRTSSENLDDPRAMIEPASRYTGVGLQTCGRGSIVDGKLL